MKWRSILERQALWDSETAIDLRLSEAEAVELYRNAPLHSLMNAAHQRRKRQPKEILSF